MQARDFERAAQRPWWLALLLAATVALLAACGGGSAAPPMISVQPSDTSAVAGSAATLSVTASGTDITYQWQESSDGGASWINVAGATQASYTTPPTTLADSGKRYRVVVSAAGASVNSSAVQLTVTAAVVAPALAVQPAAQNVTTPDPATFSVTASGTSPTYQWQRSIDGGATFVNIAGATAASYSTGATTPTMSGERYRVVVSNSAGSVTSSAVVLNINPAPVAAAFTTQPANQSVSVGTAAVFTVAVTGTPAPTLQWQRSTEGGSGFTDIAGAADPTFNTGATTLAQNGERYRAVATNSAGSATSSAAMLTVNATPQAPVITTNPTAQTVTAPSTATFTAAATGVPTPTWQWQVSSDNAVSFSNINGATSASYTTPATTLADTGKYFRAVATNATSSVNTNAARLTVSAATALAITTPTPLPQGTVGVPYSVTFEASGGTPPYTWFGGPFAGGFTLNPSTGNLTGTATSTSNFSFTVGVRDSSNPPQQFGGVSFQAAFRLACGVSELGVANEPAGFNGGICPTRDPVIQVVDGGLKVEFSWFEERDGVLNNVGVVIDNASGQLLSASASYDVGTGPRVWQCSMIDFSLPACSGIVVSPQAGTAQFTFAPLTYQGFPHNGVTITLNGMLAFPAYTPPLQPPPTP